MDNEQSRYLEYLPAIFQERIGEEKDLFLGKFLLPFERILTGFEDKLSVIDRNFSPALTPADTEGPGVPSADTDQRTREFLRWLAGWVGLTLDENWDEPKRRRLIQEAVKLHRYRGTIEGLKRNLKIYEDRVIPEIREGCWPGGMQIGVASRIGGIAPKEVSLTRIERAVRREPPITHDYYVVDTAAPANHPNIPEGQPLRLYYQADQVKRVEVVKDENGKESVKLHLLDNRIRSHSSASVFRLDDIPSEHYTLSLESGTSFYKGDTFLVNEVERPYCFIINIRIPLEAWKFLFSFQIDLPKNKEELAEDRLREKFQEEFELRRISRLNVKKKNYRWWEIEGKINEGVQRFAVVRKGVRLDVYTSVERQDWKELINVQSVKTIIDEVKPAHTLYYLKFIPEVSQDDLRPMQLGVHSTVNVDTTIG
ncbi:MAG: hypothetical protein KJ077_19890 [Anaerolineae bacterium]|nr:hypothetical protein [Anaerolineae bacterium]